MTNQTMTAPPVCLNCGHLGEILPNTPSGVDASMPVGATCAWGPTHVHIVDARIHRCAQRKPLDAPLYTVPTPPEAVQAAEMDGSALGQPFGQDGASDGLRTASDGEIGQEGGAQ